MVWQRSCTPTANKVFSILTPRPMVYPGDIHYSWLHNATMNNLDITSDHFFKKCRLNWDGSRKQQYQVDSWCLQTSTTMSAPTVILKTPIMEDNKGWHCFEWAWIHSPSNVCSCNTMKHCFIHSYFWPIIILSTKNILLALKTVSLAGWRGRY